MGDILGLVRKLMPARTGLLVQACTDTFFKSLKIHQIYRLHDPIEISSLAVRTKIMDFDVQVLNYPAPISCPSFSRTKVEFNLEFELELEYKFFLEYI